MEQKGKCLQLLSVSIYSLALAGPAASTASFSFSLFAMTFLENATNVRIDHSILRDIAGSVYDYRINSSGEPPSLIDLLDQYSAMEAMYDFRSPVCYPETGLNVKRDLQSWILEKHVPIVLLSGSAGTGKSSIARDFVHRCAIRAHYPVISFCFSRDDPRRLDFHRVIPTLARQLYAHPEMQKAMENANEEDFFIWSRSLSKQFQEFVVRPIRNSFAQGANPDLTYVILLDGLDACKDHGIIKHFLSDIKSIIDEESHHSRIKIVCTSRDDPSIITAFHSILNYYRHISTGSYDAAEDIHTFLSGNLQNMRPLPPPFSWDNVVRYITEKASGNIGYAVGVLQMIKQTNIQSADDIARVIEGYVTQPFRMPSAQPSAQDSQNRSPASPLAILLGILRKRKPEEPINTVVNRMTIEFMTDLLSVNNYVTIHAQINNNQDGENLLEFLTHVLSNNLLRSSMLIDGNRRARRLMMKLGKIRHIIPKSFYLNPKDVTMEPNPLGLGGFADVFGGYYRGNRVALKRFRNRGTPEAFREALTWKTLSHVNILPLLGIYKDKYDDMLVSPLMDSGTLSGWREDTNPSVSEIERRVVQVAEGIQYLHYEGTNVLLDSNFQVRIADFGLTRHSDATATINPAMSHQFSAPELFPRDTDMEIQEERLKRTEKTDIYAFACLYYEIHFNRLPYGRAGQYNVAKLIIEGSRPPRQPEPPLREEAWQLITRCWSQEPGDRPDIDDVLEIMVSWSL
ncbi:hypothetical protein AX15_001950 [Amanita polypyramis BW_CC]|nr:hypothetical protein AX15_001950 [Amanita polypyramis BW_CC]